MSAIATTGESMDIISGVRVLINGGAQRATSATGVAVVMQQLKPGKMLRTTQEWEQKGHCGKLSEKAQEVIERIAERSRRLAAEIQEMLKLANCSSRNGVGLPWVELDLAEVLRWCVTQIDLITNARRLVIESELTPACVLSVDNRMKMLSGSHGRRPWHRHCRRQAPTDLRRVLPYR